MRLIIWAYQICRSLRYAALSSVFGYITHCKHSESCGSYFFRQLRERGIVVGLLKGTWRIIRCW